MNNPFVVPLDIEETTEETQHRDDIAYFGSAGMRFGQVVATMAREMDMVKLATSAPAAIPEHTGGGGTMFGATVGPKVIEYFTEPVGHVVLIGSYPKTPEEKYWSKLKRYEITGLVETPYRTEGFQPAVTADPVKTEYEALVPAKRDVVAWHKPGAGDVKVFGPTFAKSEPVSQPEIDLALLFDLLAELWLDSTRFESSFVQMFSHPAYKQIVRLGTSIVPNVMQVMPDNPERWIPALEALTGNNPVPAGASREEAVDAWREWARSKLSS